MRRTTGLSAFALAGVMLLVGCLGGSEPDVPPSGEGDPLDEADVPSDLSFDPSADPNATAAATTAIPVLLDGTIGSSAAVCVLGPVGECAFVPVEEGTSGMLFEGLAGRVVGGEIVLRWDAESPATEELTTGFMMMDGGEECEGVELAGARGTSPLVLTLSAPARPLCAGEVLHLWVAGTTFGAQDPAYYQVDVDQAFHLEGAFLLAPVPDA